MKVLVVIGTRPEAIKMVSLIKTLEADLSVKVCVTGQHREMLDQVLGIFDIVPDYDLSIMRPGQDLFDITTKVILGIKQVLLLESPDLVLVHGDTTTGMAAAIAAFYLKIKVGHIEAGLRTNNLLSPFPEEFNRQIIGKIATCHFAPTHQAQNNLLSEGVKEKNIVITGNTVIDTLLLAVEKSKKTPFGRDLLKVLDFLTEGKAKMVLITGHRRENFGKGLQEICRAIENLAHLHPQVKFVYPVHLNPNVQEPVYRILSDIDNVYLIKPQSYLSFVKLLNYSCLVLTDSGGIQEEAPSLGKPVLVMRDTTERPEAIEAKVAKLVGTDFDSIVKEVNLLLTDHEVYQNMSVAVNPYGDGNACKRILKEITTKGACQQ